MSDHRDTKIVGEVVNSEESGFGVADEIFEVFVAVILLFDDPEKCCVKVGSDLHAVVVVVVGNRFVDV